MNPTFVRLALIASMVLVPCAERLPGDDQLATGFVYVKQIDGVWWFVGPDGDKFVSIGVNHIEPHLWLAPYNKPATLKKYGSDMVSADGRFDTKSAAAGKWIDRQLEICRDLGFNTFGKHTHPSIDPRLYKDQIYYVASLDTAPLAGWQERKGYGPRPDVFSSDFHTYVEKRIRRVCLQHQRSRNLLGYVYTDVPSWIMGRKDQMERNDTTMIYPWINAILPLGDASPGKWKWLGHLRTRYPDAESAAKVWGLSISPTYGISWETMARTIDWTDPVDVNRAKKDMLTFMPIIVEKWYGLHHDLVRKYDPNHLIFGDKNMSNWFHDWLLPAIKKYVDVVAVQSYHRWSDEQKFVRAIYDATGKPIFNGDGCFGFAGANQQEWGVKGFRSGAKSQQEVASLYKETLRGMMSSPFMVGWHHCGYMEQWDAAERGDSPKNENGMIDPMENYHTVLTKAVKEANKNAARMHADTSALGR